MQPATVSDLIKFLKTFPAELPVAYALFSEATLLELSDIKIVKMQSYRKDGWVPNQWGDKKLATTKYLLFPGN